MNPIETHEVYRLIEQGEGELVDFKHCITSTTKIAKAIVAFANHKGGVLLIGIKDNGKATKINCSEEAFMLEAALDKCKPKIEYLVSEHEIDGKIILAAQIAAGYEQPYLCLDEDKKWMAYVRANDSNVLANWVWLQVVKNQTKKIDNKLEYQGNDEKVLKYIKENENCTQKEISKALKLNFRKVGAVLVKIVGMGLVDLNITKEGVYYNLNV